MNLKRTQRIGLLWLLLCCGGSVLWGYLLERASPDGMIDFKGTFYAARCVIQHSDPYKDGAPLRAYLAEQNARPLPSHVLQQALSQNIYLPTTFILIAPLAILPWGLAHLLWMILSAASLLLAALLVWNRGANYAPAITCTLICFLLANCEAVLATGNPAGIVVGLCVVAVWCFLEERFVWAGVVCLAVSLAIKPHDAGLVWLYFLLAGGIFRKRALQTLLVIAIVGLPAVLWISHIAPNWLPELHANFLAQSAPGGQAYPGPNSANTGSGPSMIIDLQSAVYVFSGNPRIYNSVTYLVCVALLLVGLVRTLRSRLSQRGAWLALAAIVPVTIVVTYHRSYDAKLLMLAVPACAMLWAEGKPIRWVALLVTTAGIVFTADIPLTILAILSSALHISTEGLSGQMLTVMLTRPTPLILLAMGIFYLWVYVRSTEPDIECTQQVGE
ncbi:MAG: glycosyltransferase family 87 protein [Terracidiphilus sp.]